MHILVLLVGVLAGAAFWYYRLKTVSKASAAEIEEAVVYGKWVQGQNVPDNKAVPMLCDKILDWLDDNELEDFEGLVTKLDASSMFNPSEKRLAMMNKRLHTD